MNTPAIKPASDGCCWVNVRRYCEAWGISFDWLLRDMERREGLTLRAFGGDWHVLLYESTLQRIPAAVMAKMREGGGE